MLRCGKTSQTAIAAMSLLAQRYDGGRTRLSSLDIAAARQLPVPLVAKLLTSLSTAGLVSGTRGPGGGYWLSVPPEAIALADIVSVFEKDIDRMLCPFGPHWCGTGDPCPMHDSLTAFDAQWAEYLNETKLSVFSTLPL